MAPLPVSLALGARRALHDVARVAGEAHHVVQVEAVPNGAPVDGTARVTAADSFTKDREREEKEGEKHSWIAPATLQHPEPYTKSPENGELVNQTT